MWLTKILKLSKEKKTLCKLKHLFVGDTLRNSLITSHSPKIREANTITENSWNEIKERPKGIRGKKHRNHVHLWLVSSWIDWKKFECEALKLRATQPNHSRASQFMRQEKKKRTEREREPTKSRNLNKISSNDTLASCIPDQRFTRAQCKTKDRHKHQQLNI